jgi:hypothetical protein
MNKVSLIQKISIIAGRNQVSIFNNIVKRQKGNKLQYSLIIMLFLASCSEMGKTGQHETPTRGNIKIAVDESFQPVIDAEISTFTQLYVNAKIKADYKPEYDVVNDFMNDSVKVMVTSKKLSDYQIQIFGILLHVATNYYICL